MKKNRNKLFICFTAIIGTFFLTSCATTVTVKVTRPGKLDLNGAKTIAVLPFEQSTYNPFDYRFDEEEGSVEKYFNQYNNIRYAEKRILDSLHNKIENGIKLSPYITLVDYIPTETALKYRSKIPVDVFISGDVVSFKVYDFIKKVKVQKPAESQNAEIQESDKKETSVSSEKKKTDTDYYYVNEYIREVQLIFKYQIMNGTNMEVLGYDTVNIDKISNNVKDRKNLPDVYSLVSSDIDDFVTNLLHDIQPYTINKSITLLKDETEDKLLENADKLAKDGNIKQSYNEFISIYNETGIFEAGYNAGMLLLAMGYLHDAENLMYKVYQDSGNPKALDALYDIKNEIKQAKRLNDQIGN